LSINSSLSLSSFSLSLFLSGKDWGAWLGAHSQVGSRKRAISREAWRQTKAVAGEGVAWIVHKDLGVSLASSYCLTRDPKCGHRVWGALVVSLASSYCLTRDPKCGHRVWGALVVSLASSYCLTREPKCGHRVEGALIVSLHALIDWPGHPNVGMGIGLCGHRVQGARIGSLQVISVSFVSSCHLRRVFF